MARTEVPRERAAKRRAIIEGAAVVFARRGYGAGTTKDVAAEVNLTQPAIYHYVGSKADLLYEIAIQVNDDMLAALDGGLATSGGAREKLRGVIDRFTAAVVADRSSFAVYWQETHALPDEVRSRLAESQRYFVRRVAELVQELQEVGDLPQGPSTAVAEAILSMPSWTYHWYQPRGRLSAGEISAIFCELLGLDG